MNHAMSAENREKYEYIFRAKQKFTKEWVEGNLIESNYIHPIGNIVYTPYRNNNKGTRFYAIDAYEIDPNTLSQFTESYEFTLDDEGNPKDGERLFFGDIILVESSEYGKGVYLIFFNRDKWKCDLKHLSGAHSDGDSIISIKRIGNKWDNPELFK